MKKLLISVIMTSFNRKEDTVGCIKRVMENKASGIEIKIFVLDDNSIDGTAEAIASEFPSVKVISGKGNAYWNGGMRIAWRAASEDKPDFYLWLNDDTLLNENALQQLLRTSSFFADQAIIVGSTKDPITGSLTYGGVRRLSRIRPLRFTLVEPANEPVSADTMNGNCVLIPNQVYRHLDLLSPEFTHGMGDFDYGLRARKAGIRTWIAPGFVGTCSRNAIEQTWQDQSRPRSERWEKVRSVKGLPPREWATFAYRHGGFLWPLWWATPYMRLLLKSLPRRRVSEGQAKPRVSLLVNIIAPYRLPIYLKLAEAFDLRVSVAGKEGNRQWDELGHQLEKAGVPVQKAWGFTLTQEVKSKQGVQDLRYAHVSPGYLWNLWRDRPDAIISNEMGGRTILALLYGTLMRRPVWVWWGGTVHTERNRNVLKRFVRAALVFRVKHWISYGLTSTEYLFSIGVPKERILQIQNSVDEYFYSQPSEPVIKPSVRPHLLYVGQLIGRKGVVALLESVARLQIAGHEFALTLVGGGPDRLELIEMSEKLHLRHVEFLPPQSASQMPGVYRSADVLVFPTLEDVWGLVVNEAMWSNIPVVCSIYAGCAQEIVPEANRFDPLDSSDMDQAILRAVTGQLHPVDVSPLLSTAEVSHLIIANIVSELRA